MINRRHFLGATVGVVAAPFVLRHGLAQSPEFTLKLHHFLGPNAPAHTRMLQPWAERIMADSGGRVAIELYPAMSLGGAPPQLFRQVADGVVDIVWTVNGYSPGLFPHSEVFELPTVYTNNIEATNLAMRDLEADWLGQDFADVHVCFMHVHAGQAIHMANIPVRQLSDLADTKIRVPGPTGNAVVEAMGATPVTMPVPDLPQALTTSAVDGALIPWEIIPPLQLQDSTDFQIEGPDNHRFGTTTFQVSMNKGVWESLPEDLQAVFDAHSGEDWLREVAQVWRDSDDHGIGVAVEAGNEHIILDDTAMEEFNAAMATVVDRWVEEHASDDFDAEAYVDAAREAIAVHSS